MNEPLDLNIDQVRALLGIGFILRWDGPTAITIERADARATVGGAVFDALLPDLSGIPLDGGTRAVYRLKRHY